MDREYNIEVDGKQLRVKGGSYKGHLIVVTFNEKPEIGSNIEFEEIEDFVKYEQDGSGTKKRNFRVEGYKTVITARYGNHANVTEVMQVTELSEDEVYKLNLGKESNIYQHYKGSIYEKLGMVRGVEKLSDKAYLYEYARHHESGGTLERIYMDNDELVVENRVGEFALYKSLTGSLAGATWLRESGDFYSNVRVSEDKEVERFKKLQK